MPGYAQRAVFFHLEIVTGCASLQYYTVLVYVSVLVGSVHLRLFPIFPHVFHCQAHLLDTIYCVHVSNRTYIQCTPVPVRCACCPCGRVAVRARPRACVRVRVCGRVCAPADAWSTVDFFVRRPCVACLACPLSVCVWARVLAVLACSRACLLPCLSAPVVRAYIVASPAVLLLAVLLSPPAANFFEIVFKPSISVQLSSAGMGDAS